MAQTQESSVFVPADFAVPGGLADGALRLVPLGPEHNDRDYFAWTSSMEHIRRTPGFEAYEWPKVMTLDDNLNDLRRHADDFHRRSGFTYSVMIGDDVIGCVYIYPSGRPGQAAVRSWVRADFAEVDEELYRLVSEWLEREWPFSDVVYSPRTNPHELVQ